MEPWFNKYTTAAPWGILAFTLLPWSLGDSRGLTELAQYPELGVLTFVVVAALVEEVATIFYAIARNKRIRREEKEWKFKEFATRLQAVADEGAETATVQRLLNRLEEQDTDKAR